jgi:hypothetical protein
MADKRFFKFMAGLTFLFIFLSASYAQEIKLLPVLTIGKDSSNEQEMIGNITDLAVGSNFIYILDDKITRVQKYSKTGEFVASIGKIGQGPGEFENDLRSIATDGKGHVIVGGTRKIYIFDESGQFINSFPVDFQMNHLDVDREGKILAVGYKKDRVIQVYDQQGNHIASFGEPFEAPSKFSKYKNFPIVKLPFRVFCPESGRVCFINPYKFEIYVYKDGRLEKKIESPSDYFRPTQLIEFAQGFAIVPMDYAIFEQGDLLYVSLFDGEKGKSELILISGNKRLAKLELDHFPVAMDDDGYLYSVVRPDVPYVAKYLVKLSSAGLD